MNIKDWLIEQYDIHVGEQGVDGAPIADTRDAVAERYAAAVEAGEVERSAPSLVDEGRSLFAKFIEPTRERRRSTMRKGGTGLQNLIDALNDDTVLGTSDPCLAQAYPLGNGADKTLHLWTVEDWQVATTQRYRGAAAATASASDFDENIASPIITAMRRAGVRTTGELFRAPQAVAA